MKKMIFVAIFSIFLNISHGIWAAEDYDASAAGATSVMLEELAQGRRFVAQPPRLSRNAAAAAAAGQHEASDRSLERHATQTPQQFQHRQSLLVAARLANENYEASASATTTTLDRMLEDTSLVTRGCTVVAGALKTTRQALQDLGAASPATFQSHHALQHQEVAQLRQITLYRQKLAILIRKFQKTDRELAEAEGSCAAPQAPRHGTPQPPTSPY